eukprot:TRINITY_DN29738_c0_g1_i2.p1 TRINITY_DN29738_c0_g1~~TRINITY_DN29738_c0_g1_i2.p1  ORF type:complete len:480 (-),score=70.83 TRINITY_DN29738_c0_g1_i2:64-1464(-)
MVEPVVDDQHPDNTRERKRNTVGSLDHQSVFVAISASFFFLFLYYSFFARFAVLIYTQYGLSAHEIGIIGLASILAAVPASTLWGMIADRSGRRKLVLAFCISSAAIFQTLLCLTPYFESHESRFIYCCANIVGFTILRGNDYGQFRGIAMRALDRCNRQQSYGSLRLWGAVSWGIAHTVLGWVLDKSDGNLQWLFIGNGVAALLAVLCICCTIPSAWTDEQTSPACAEERATGQVATQSGQSAQPEQSNDEEPKASIGQVLRIVCWKPEIVSWLLCAAALAMGMQHVFQFLFLYMKQRFNSPDDVMGMSVTVTVIFEVPIFAEGKRLVGALGATGLIAIAMTSFFVRVLGYTLVPSAGWILLLEPLHGVTYSCFTLATVHYLNDHVPMRMVSTAQGFMTSVGGIGAALGAVLGGYVMEQPNGGLILFRADSVVMAAVLVLFLVSQARARRQEGGHQPPLLESAPY